VDMVLPAVSEKRRGPPFLSALQYGGARHLANLEVNRGRAPARRCPAQLRSDPGRGRGRGRCPRRRSVPRTDRPHGGGGLGDRAQALPDPLRPARGGIAGTDLRVRAHELAGRDDSRDALLEWLGDVLTYSVTARGLAAALAYDTSGSDLVHGNSCAATLEEAANPLLQRAVQDGNVADGVTGADLITLIVGIVLATEHRSDPAAEADRLFRLTVVGLSPRCREGGRSAGCTHGDPPPDHCGRA
jgi:hypothetical protein